LPKSDIDDAEKHNKIDTIGGNLKVKIKEAVKGNGHPTAQCPDGHKKPKRIVLQFYLFDPAETSYQKYVKSANQRQKTDPSGFYQQLQWVMFNKFLVHYAINYPFFLKGEMGKKWYGLPIFPQGRNG